MHFSPDYFPTATCRKKEPDNDCDDKLKLPQSVTLEKKAERERERELERERGELERERVREREREENGKYRTLVHHSKAPILVAVLGAFNKMEKNSNFKNICGLVKGPITLW
jgi:hypothetical protein